MAIAFSLLLFFIGACLMFSRRTPWARALGLTLMFGASKSYPRGRNRLRRDNQWGE